MALSIKGLHVTLSMTILPLWYMSCFIYCYAECHYAECRYAECHYAKCHYAECYYAECRYAEFHYAESQGALSLIPLLGAQIG